VQPRFYCPVALVSGATIHLPEAAVRHVQVLRMQPGQCITLFQGDTDQEFDATIETMGRSHVSVLVGASHQTRREAALSVHLVVAIPANDRMDWLVEKACEWGVTALYPTMTERSVVRLSAERAEKKVAHWQSIAVAACEQCGGNRVPHIASVMGFAQRLHQLSLRPIPSLLLSLQPSSMALGQWMQSHSSACSAPEGVAVISGPEGGLSPAEERMAQAHGCTAISLGRRVLRAETAAVSALAILLHSSPSF
jgi:16S rRNA (uracil1498-N3)-methyltransferase